MDIAKTKKLLLSEAKIRTKQLNEVTRMQQLAGINEIKIDKPGEFSAEDLKQLETLTQFFGEGLSPAEEEPIEEDYNMDIFDEDDDDERYLAFKYLTSRKNGKYFFKDFFGFRDPNTPNNGYETIVTITNDNINVAANSIDDGYGVGWYTKDGQFHIN